MFSPLVFTTETHLLAAKIKQTVLHKISSSNFYKINLFLDLKCMNSKETKASCQNKGSNSKSLLKCIIIMNFNFVFLQELLSFNRLYQTH